MNFMEELLLEAEQAEEKQRIELDKTRADQLLMAIEKLEGQLDDVNKVVTEEINIIEEYRESEEGRIQKKVRWLAWNLEQYIKSTEDKTIRLPHGTIKLRMGRDKVEIVDLQKFLEIEDNQKFLKVVPESYKPDIQSIQEYIKKTGDIPVGTNFINGEVKFSFTTLKRSKDNDNISE